MDLEDSVNREQLDRLIIQFAKTQYVGITARSVLEKWEVSLEWARLSLRRLELAGKLTSRRYGQLHLFMVKVRE